MPEHPELNFVPKRVQTDPVAEALELFPYALYIVGSRGSDNINGMMADWVMQVGSSRVDLQACKLEYSIVSPK